MQGRKRGWSRMAAASLAVAMFACGLAGAGEWPQKNTEITYVVNANPGGSSHAQALIAKDALEKYLGCRITLQNVPGAGGLLGVNKVFQLPAGTSLAWSSTIDGIWSFFYLAPSRVPWKIEDFKVLGIFTNLMNQGLFCKKGAPWNDFADLIEDARKRPEKDIVVASLGPGRLEDLLMIEIQEHFGVKFKWVFYDSSSSIQTDILTGDVDVGFAGAANKNFVDHPEFKVLTIMTKDFPDDFALKDEFKTLRDFEERLGFKCEDLPAVGVGGMATWIVRADTPDHVYDKLVEAVRKTAHDPEWREKMSNFACTTYISPKDCEPIYKNVISVFEHYLPLHKKYVER